MKRKNIGEEEEDNGEGDDVNSEDRNDTKNSEASRRKKILTKEVEYYNWDEVKSRITKNDYLRFSIPYNSEKHDWYEWWQSGGVEERGADELVDMELDGKYKIPRHQWHDMSIKKIYVSDEDAKDAEKMFLIKLPVKEIKAKIYQCKRCERVFEKKDKGKLEQCKRCFKKVCFKCLKQCHCLVCRQWNGSNYYCVDNCYELHNNEPKERECPSCKTKQLLEYTCEKCWSSKRICKNCVRKCEKVCCQNEDSYWDVGRFCPSHYEKHISKN